YPHFLYNTLDSINWAARVSGQKKISEIAESLGYLMRTAIDTRVSLISLEDELRIVSSYITIQSYRFEERLDFKMDVPDSMRHTEIPKFVLQPLDRKSTRLNSSHVSISYAVFCLKKKTTMNQNTTT